jgi:hypothetical protein
MPWEKEQYCKDLVKFVEVVGRYDQSDILYNSLGILHNVSYQFQYSNSNRLEINDIELRMHKKTSGTIPSEVQSLSIYIDCLCDIDLTIDPDDRDIINDYSLQLVIIGYSIGGEYLNCWHLDKDIPPNGLGIHNHTHPSYHFQAGGHRAEGLDTGQLLLLGAPRLPHPPMDIFLAIHFVICNFFGKKDFPFLEYLFADTEYQDILERAKQRMFDPYFQAFKEGCTHQDFNMGKVFPLAV